MSGLGLASWLSWPWLGCLSPWATQTVNYFLLRSVPAASQAQLPAPCPMSRAGMEGEVGGRVVGQVSWGVWVLGGSLAKKKKKEEEEERETKHRSLASDINKGGTKEKYLGSNWESAPDLHLQLPSCVISDGNVQPLRGSFQLGQRI